jgi:hypothetical protein
MALPLSSNPLNVAARTLTGANASHSLKAAETAARCAHTRQGVKRVTEASGWVWRVICGAYGLGKNRSRPNGLHHLAQNGLDHLARTSEHHLARASEHHKLSGTSKHHKLEGVSLYHLALRSCAHLAAHGRARIGSNSRAHIVAAIRRRLGDANTRQTSGQLAAFKGHASRLHSRSPPVGYI